MSHLHFIIGQFQPNWKPLGAVACRRLRAGFLHVPAATRTRAPGTGSLVAAQLEARRFAARARTLVVPTVRVAGPPAAASTTDRRLYALRAPESLRMLSSWFGATCRRCRKNIVWRT